MSGPRKLTDEQLVDVLERLTPCPHCGLPQPMRKLAVKHGVSVVTIHKIATGQHAKARSIQLGDE